MSQIPHTSPFDAIRHEDEHGKEYWSARELYKLLGYSRWEKFQKSIEEAKIACENSGQAVSDHFHLEVQLIAIGKSAKRKTEDYRLSRYACYLIVQNADPNKPIVALGQTYFAYQTRRQEIADELELTALPEDQKRIILRSMLATFNVRLQEAAQQAGVVEPSDFATFYDHEKTTYTHARVLPQTSRRFQTIWAPRSWALTYLERLRQTPNYGATRSTPKDKPTSHTTR
jgi:DNA-damage-inducible protein D